MNLQKHNPLISKALRDAWKGKLCINPWCDCGGFEFCVGGCHYTGIRQHDYGKGRGIKCSDLCMADLCDWSHQYFDVQTIYKSIRKSEEFQHCVILTLIRRQQEGVIKV